MSPTAPTSTRCVLVLQHVWMCCTCPADAPPPRPPSRSHPCLLLPPIHTTLFCSVQPAMEGASSHVWTTHRQAKMPTTMAPQMVSSRCLVPAIVCIVLSALQHHSMMAALCHRGHPAQQLTPALSSAGYTCMCNQDANKPELAVNGKNCTGTLNVFGVITMCFVAGCMCVSPLGTTEPH